MTANTSDRERRAQCVTILAEAYRQKISPATLAAYEMALEDVSPASVEQAVKAALKSCKFMPNAAELRELAGGKTSAENALIAWAAVDRATSEVGGYKSPDFLDPVVNAVIRNMGGWERFCTATVTEFDTWLRKEFLRVYELIAKRGVGDEEGAPLVGLHERHNRLNGFSDRNTTVEIAVGLPAPAKRPRLDGPKGDMSEAG